MKIEQDAVVGFIDRIAEGRVRGWVVDLGRSQEAVEVVLLIDGQEVARQPTVLNRPDVAWKHDCHSGSGFDFAIPYAHVARTRFEIEVREARTGRSLPLSDGALAAPAHALELPQQEVERARLAQSLHEQFRGQVDALLRLNHDPFIRLAGLDPDLARVWIINGAEHSASELFRAYALAQSLRRLGVAALIFREVDVPFLRPSTQAACFFVRVAHGEAVAHLVKRLRAAGTAVIADFDDLVFRPSLLGTIDGVRFLTPEQREAYRDGMHRYRRMLETADCVTVTTEPLRREAGAVASRVLRLGNYPLPDARRAASGAMEPHTEAGGLRIGYYSGTLTHQADLGVCAAGLVAFLKAYPDATLRLVGRVDMSEFPALAALPNVEHAPLMSYEDMIRDIARCDLVIAPLQVGDPFCECKSELKFFDAALVGVPVLASPTASFRDVIQHGVNGFLADGEADWFGTLQQLALERATLRRVARAASESAAARFSIAAQDVAVQAVLQACAPQDRLPFGVVPAAGAAAAPVAASLHLAGSPRPDRPRLAVLLPDIGPGSGGHRKVLTWCNRYARAGGAVSIFIMSSRSDAELLRIVEEHYFADCGVVRAYDDIEPDADIAVATSWPTAYAVARWKSVPERCYFIQDFEPLFSPMSTDYALAYHSYRLGLKPVVFGDWNSRILHKEFGLETTPVRFPVDREVYHPPQPTERREPIILFYARPSQPRRLFELGLESLRRLRAWLPGFRFVLFGEDLAGMNIDGFESLGRQTDLHLLAAWYRRARLGICFSPTNPSALTFEMLACGLPVVDVDVGMVSDDFAGCPALVRCEPTVDALEKQLYKLASDADRCAELSGHAARWAERLPVDAEFADDVLARLGLGLKPGARSGREAREA